MPAPSSPASQLLAANGVRVRDLAVVAGTSPATVSRWLSGVYRRPDEFAAVLERFLEPPEARAVLDAIPKGARHA
jgi:transcriptional regulator with XRE-family HTH domain